MIEMILAVGVKALGDQRKGIVNKTLRGRGCGKERHVRRHDRAG
jgi:hypothetical protein